jgi:periplasmic divalent cation tolerance protein
MLIAWTTVATQADADRISADCIAKNLAVCAQVEGPITSHYRWQGKIETAVEWRITFKCFKEQSEALATHVQAVHPYEVPEWVAVETELIGEKYLSWARAARSSINL